VVILDTNIIIDHLRRNTGESFLFKLSKQLPVSDLSLSAISIQELYEGKSTKQPQKEKQLLAVIAPIKILPYTFETAKLAGEIARDLTNPIEIADSAIAATAILNNAQLVTLNQKHFTAIKQLTLFKY